MHGDGSAPEPLIPPETLPIFPSMGIDNVDRRLLPRFEASAAQERARRELLPPEWINAEPRTTDGPVEPFESLVARARERVRRQRAELDRRGGGTPGSGPRAPSQSQA